MHKNCIEIIFANGAHKYSMWKKIHMEVICGQIYELKCAKNFHVDLILHKNYMQANMQRCA